MSQEVSDVFGLPDDGRKRRKPNKNRGRAKILGIHAILGIIDDMIQKHNRGSLVPRDGVVYWAKRVFKIGDPIRDINTCYRKGLVEVIDYEGRPHCKPTQSGYNELKKLHTHGSKKKKYGQGQFRALVEEYKKNAEYI